MIQINHNQNSGFALLITLFVVMAVVTVAVSIIELSMKQLELSITAKDSEIAFSAANAGMECARYIQKTEFEDMLDGESVINPKCFGDQTLRLQSYENDLTFSGPNNSNDYKATLYITTDSSNRKKGVSWPPSVNDRCTEMQILAVQVDLEASHDLTIGNIRSEFPGWQGVNTKTCYKGSDCYIMQVTGYNNACGSTDTDTLRREVLLEL